MSARVLPWVLASRNEGKLRELRALFAARNIDVVDLRDVAIAEDADAEEEIESFDTFEENALAKARYFSRLLPGRMVLADDSGLAVDALGGAPGVRSKRWSADSAIAGASIEDSNNALLVSRMRSEANRSARFVCAAALTDGDDEWVARGEVEGRIVDVARGAHGFGYDPHVYVDELGMTMAEATVEEKGRVSHRARAFTRLLRVAEEAGLGR